MIHSCTISKDSGVRVTFEGGIKDAVVDTMHFIGALYNDMLEEDPGLANVYRYLLTRAVNDKDSPLWLPFEKEEGDVSIAFPSGAGRMNN